MKRDMVTISDNGTVNMPTNVQMRDFEIAELFGVMVPTVKGKIREILKEGVCIGDFSTSCTVEGLTVYPDYYGLDMLVAVAFRVQSHEAKLFRQWVLRKMTVAQNPFPPLYIRLKQGAMPN